MYRNTYGLDYSTLGLLPRIGTLLNILGIKSKQMKDFENEKQVKNQITRKCLIQNGMKKSSGRN
jgi:hypothetical protein